MSTRVFFCASKMVAPTVDLASGVSHGHLEDTPMSRRRPMRFQRRMALASGMSNHRGGQPIM
jgi:hypothetical protein